MGTWGLNNNCINKVNNTNLASCLYPYKISEMHVNPNIFQAMEGGLTRSSLEPLVKEENSVESNGEEGVEQIVKVSNKRKIYEENTSNTSSPNQEEISTSKQDDQLGFAKLEMEEVKEENDRLKTLLDRVMKDYQTLQMHIFDIVQQEQQPKESPHTNPSHEGPEESELVSLRLGRSSSERNKGEEKQINLNKSKHEEDLQEGLTLGLDSKFEVSKSYQMERASNPSPENSTEELKKDEVGEQWQANKILKTARSQDDEPSQHAIVKKTRVSVRARCDTPTMNDGCQWRKYGQKTAKGNPCPRAYYRCTVAPACPVRKQVQRSVEDMSILITTYEGTHNHPLPISASAMASTTSAAASMLMSGSSSSSRAPLGGPNSTTTTTNSDLHRLLNFNPSHTNSRPNQFYLPNPSSYISSSPSHPTITLDLTAPSSSLSSLASGFPTKPRYSPPSFNFSSIESNPIPTSWSNAYSTSYGPQPINKTPMGSLYLGRQTQNQAQAQVQAQIQQHFPYMQKNPLPLPISHETIAAATKVITSDPNFRSALTAAITSIVGNGGAIEARGNQGGRHDHDPKWDEPLAASSNHQWSSSPFSSVEASEVENGDKAK